MQNYRSNTYTSGDASIRNANKYFNSELPVYEPIVPAYGEGEEGDYSFDTEANTVYLNFGATNMTLYPMSINELQDTYGMIKNVDDGFQGLAAFSELKSQANYLGYVEINADNKELVDGLIAQILALFGISDPAEIEMYGKEMMFYNTGTFSDAFDIANVGIYKSGD